MKEARPRTEAEGNPPKKTYAEIFLEERKKIKNQLVMRPETPIFITSDKSPAELFSEAKETLEKYNEARVEVDEEGFTPTKGKRKYRSPANGERGKRSRLFSPGKTGRLIFHMIRNQGTVDIVSLEETYSESNTDDSNIEEDYEEKSARNNNKDAAGKQSGKPDDKPKPDDPSEAEMPEERPKVAVIDKEK